MVIHNLSLYLLYLALVLLLRTWYYHVNNVVNKVVNNVICDKWYRHMMISNELLSIAIKETQNLISGEIFLVRDLFKGYEWNRISRSDRLLLGTLFLNYANTSGTHVVPIEKTSSGQQQYKIQKA